MESESWEVVQDTILAFKLNVPDMVLCREKLHRLLSTEAWKSYSPPIGKYCEPATFAEWVSGDIPRGLDTTVANLREIAKGDGNLDALLDAVLQRPAGNATGSNQYVKSGNVDNIQSSKPPTGTSELAGRRRLRKDRPDLDALVDSGQLSTHAAMVQAGFRPKTFTVRADDPESLAATLRRQLDPEVLAQLKRLIG